MPQGELNIHMVSCKAATQRFGGGGAARRGCKSGGEAVSATAVSANRRRPPMQIQATGPDGRVPCARCGRRFAQERIATHQYICAGLKHGPPRRPMAASSSATAMACIPAALERPGRRHQQTHATPSSRCAGARGAPGHGRRSLDAGRTPSAARSAKWRQQSAALRMAIRAARGGAAMGGAALGGRSERGGAVDGQRSVGVGGGEFEPCVHCGRTFAPAAWERHVPKCKFIQAKPPPPPPWVLRPPAVPVPPSAMPSGSEGRRVAQERMGAYRHGVAGARHSALGPTGPPLPPPPLLPSQESLRDSSGAGPKPKPMSADALEGRRLAEAILRQGVYSSEAPRKVSIEPSQARRAGSQPPLLPQRRPPQHQPPRVDQEVLPVPAPVPVPVPVPVVVMPPAPLGLSRGLSRGMQSHLDELIFGANESSQAPHRAAGNVRTALATARKDVALPAALPAAGPLSRATGRSSCMGANPETRPPARSRSGARAAPPMGAINSCLVGGGGVDPSNRTSNENPLATKDFMTHQVGYSVRR